MTILRTPVLFLVCLAFAAGESSGRPPSETGEAGLWRVRSGQAVMGVIGGTLGAVLGGAAGFLVAPPCVYDDPEATGVHVAVARSCGYGIPAGLALGALAGVSLGLYAVGGNGGGEGSYLATLGGTAAGLAAGLCLAAEARPPVEWAYALTAALSTLSGLAAYHWTDRVRVEAAWEGGAAEPAAAASRKPARSLRTEVRVALLRFRPHT